MVAAAGRNASPSHRSASTLRSGTRRVRWYEESPRGPRDRSTAAQPAWEGEGEGGMGAEGAAGSVWVGQDVRGALGHLSDAS